MSDIALRTVGLGKMYRIGGERAKYRTLRDTVVQTAKRPIERIRHPGAATHVSQEIWALRDLDLEVKSGQALGIIGRNGAGKSTLLKILSHITEPTEGRAEIRGRVASLLEVGTGFHGELTGRENIQLNGAILGMTRAEIKRKFDDIVDFSEIGRFLDTPVKRYSSGMYVRLAFAVAAHLEPEILVVDEVLAVGDANFQKKCLGKMEDVAGQGRTVLFVSHNLNVIRTLCPRAVLLEGGRIKADGPAHEVLQGYLASGVVQGGERTWPAKSEAPHGEHVWLKGARVLQDGIATDRVDIVKPVTVEVDFVNEKEGARLFVDIQLCDSYSTLVIRTVNEPKHTVLGSEWFCEPHPRGVFRYSCTFPGNFLNDNQYYAGIIVGSPNPTKREMYADRAISFEVVETEGIENSGVKGASKGLVRAPVEWRGELLEAGES